jgi:hypothetical protein
VGLQRIDRQGVEMPKSRQKDLIKFDSRMTEYNLTHGILTQEELDKHLKELPDLANETLPLTLEDDSHKENQH